VRITPPPAPSACGAAAVARNLNHDELAQRQRIGRAYLGLDDEGLEAAIAADELMEISHDS
jgi:hypothetical protein